MKTQNATDAEARTIMDTSIFSAFPKAVVSGMWQIGECKHGTIEGNTFNKIADLDVVIDEGANSQTTETPEVLNADLLLYAKPEQLPTLNANALVSGYMLYNSETGTFYEITDAGIGKNQETGRIEHVELKGLVATAVFNG